MKLSSMRYKSFVWPHNPRVYTISFQRNMALHKVPFGRYRLQGLGMTRRVMKGEGEFAGEDAYRQIQALSGVFYENTPGVLVHPLWNTTSAWFVNLELVQEPREDYVKYRFEFWEDYTGYQTGVETIAPLKAAAPVAAVKVAGANAGGTAGGNGVTGSQENTAGGGSGQPATALTHRVTQGQTLWGIAQKYGLELNELIALNPQIKNPNLIYVGQEVRVK